MIHILLCGGSGTRLWPLSRKLQPKQFIKLFDNRSLFQNNYIGNKKIVSKTIIVCNLDHHEIAAKQLESFGDQDIHYILEPMGRNTAAAIALALQSVSKEEMILITPSDHQIEYSETYFQAIKQAKSLAKQDNIVLFGIVPHKPETGYGYIETVGENVIRFHEKPNLETALRYLTQGNFYWNSGMLCFKAKVFLDAMKLHAKEILELSKLAYRQALIESKVIKITPQDMEKIPSMSIDYALLEKVSLLKMIACAFRWSDLGSFDSLFYELGKDLSGNAKTAPHCYEVNAQNNLVIGGDKKVIALIDVEDFVIIDTEEALLISKRGSTQKVKEIVNQLKGTCL